MSEESARYVVLVEEEELSAAQVARIMHRSPNWVAAHAVEMGGYRDEGGTRWRIPRHGMRAFQERMAAKAARASMRRRA